MVADGSGEYNQRSYRMLHKARDLQYFTVKVKDSDLAIGVDADSFADNLLPYCHQVLTSLRGGLEEYLKLHPQFRYSFTPVEAYPNAPPVAQEMAKAAAMAGVGPMAAVAGAFAAAIGQLLLSKVKEVVVENGGDIFLSARRTRTVAVFAGESRFSYKIGILVKPEETPLGICTSSGTVGHSVSFGKADAVVIKGVPAALADAVATGAANFVKTEEDVSKAIAYARRISGVTGIMAIKRDKMAVWGEMEIVPISREE
ncbi:MAG: UPF0280 family protein [Syntrophomonadaceae bacterium]|jgi:ApbE superfamily uncharacterized protein (UPF0280 family)